MELKDLLVQARQIWGDDFVMSKEEIAIALGVVYGDICRAVRDKQTDEELKKELGNVIFSTVRWIDDLGLNVEECLELAIKAQTNFVKEGKHEQ